MHIFRMVLVVFLLSCGIGTTAQIDSAPRMGTSPQVNAPDMNTDAAPYWRAFRQAVLDDNKDKLFSLTRFPFEVRGPHASDPVDYYDRSCFAAIFRRVVVQRVALPSGEKSMLQLINEKSEIGPADYQSPDAIQVHQFEFRRINGEWLFTRAYLRML